MNFNHKKLLFDALKNVYINYVIIISITIAMNVGFVSTSRFAKHIQIKNSIQIVDSYTVAGSGKTLTFNCVKATFNIKFSEDNFATLSFSKNADEIENELTDITNSQIESLDFSGMEEILSKLSDGEISIFGSASFLSKIKGLISGEVSVNQQSVIKTILNIFFDDVLSFLPFISIIIAIAVTYSMIATARPNMKKNSIGELIHFVCYGAIIIIVCSAVTQMISLTTNTISSIKNQMDVVFPILLTVMTALGGTTSVSVYQPAMALLSTTIMAIFTRVLLPLFIFSFVFTIMSNLTSSIKFNKFADFAGSTFKWIIGIVFTIFLAFVSIQGITAGSVDGISIKTAKYAIKSSVPIVGGYMSDGFSLIMASSNLIKNSVGAGGLILLLSTCIVPILKLVIFMFSLKLAGAILEPVVDSKISSFITSVGKTMGLLISIIVSIAFSYFIMTGLIMQTCNII